jgi:excisionase family DNA binding protein
MLLSVPNNTSGTTTQQLRQALEAHHQALKELEEALLAYEESLPQDHLSEQAADGQVLQLISIDEVCRALGMGKSWTYRKIKSGEIPSIKLGRSIKIKHEDLEEYLESRRYRPDEEE